MTPQTHVPELQVEAAVLSLARRAAAVRACPWENGDGEPVSALLLLDTAGGTTAVIPAPIGEGDWADVLAHHGGLVLRRGLRRVKLPVG